jgi:hypothetical protein
MIAIGRIAAKKSFAVRVELPQKQAMLTNQYQHMQQK